MGGKAPGGQGPDSIKPVNQMTKEQNEAIRILCKAFVVKYPNIKILGHNQISAQKGCPQFYVPAFLRSWLIGRGCKAKNILEFASYNRKNYFYPEGGEDFDYYPSLAPGHKVKFQASNSEYVRWALEAKFNELPSGAERP